MGSESIKSKRRFMVIAVSRNARAFASSEPSTAAGSGIPQCAVMGCPGQTGQTSPAAVEGPDEIKARAFLDTAITMKRRLELMLSLPMQSLDSLALQKRVNDIGAQ